MKNLHTLILITSFVFLCAANCSKPKAPSASSLQTADMWLTTASQSSLVQRQSVLRFESSSNNHQTITIDTSQMYQVIEGFGYTLTGGSAQLINALPAAEKTALLKELFGNDEKSISISYLRISIGASDLDAKVFSYNDLPAGETDITLSKFSLAPDRINLIPVLKEILKINPSIKIMGSPWSAPVWMKDNGSSIGGSLKPEYYSVYAQYFVKYIQQMKAEGITVDAITPQNEPLHPGNNPSMYMTSAQQADFIKNHLGPAFQATGITTKIIIYDHNADRPDYPISILNDPAAKKYVSGSAFHLYAGTPDALSQVHNAHPDKDIYFTEQWTGAKGDFAGDLRWHLKNVIIGTTRNWSRTALEWNLASDPFYSIHTPGGCTECKGAITIDNGNVSRNVGYYIIAHASKFVPPGSVRIGSNISGNIHNVAFKTPDGKKILIVLNDGSGTENFNVKSGSQWFSSSLPSGAVATYTWQ